MIPALMDDHFEAYYDEYHGALEPEEPERPRDRRIDEAKEVLLADFFGAQPERVFYWITGRALGELAAEGRVGTALMPLVGPINVRFYWSTRLRYWRRSAEAVRQLVARYSRPELTRAVGQHADRRSSHGDRATARSSHIRQRHRRPRPGARAAHRPPLDSSSPAYNRA
jgi:hypothetical protein